MKKEAKILIVEDEEPMLRSLTDEFTEAGFDVVQARNGEEGLKAVLEDGVDLVLLDIILPKMDGMTMLKKMRADSKGANMPVILLTNLDYSVGVAKAMESGAYDYLVKTDWTLSDVVEKVKERLNQE